MFVGCPILRGFREGWGGDLPAERLEEHSRAFLPSQPAPSPPPRRETETPRDLRAPTPRPLPIVPVRRRNKSLRLAGLPLARPAAASALPVRRQETVP